MEQTVLVLNGMALPEPDPKNYSVQPEMLSVLKKMISGRIVKEIRKETTVVFYAYDYFTDAQWLQLQEILKSKNPITVSYKAQGVADLVTEEMWVDTYTRPKYQWSYDTGSIWSGFSVTLKGVDPH